MSQFYFLALMAFLLNLLACSNTVPEVGFLTGTPRASLVYDQSVIVGNQTFLKAQVVNVSLESKYTFSEVALGEGPSCEQLSWTTSAPSYPLQLSTGDGEKIISYRLKLKDTILPCVSQTVILDTTAPKAVSLVASSDLELAAVKYVGAAGKVDLQFAALDVNEMKVSQTSDCSEGAWEPYRESISGFSLSGNDGVKDLSVKFRNVFGVETSCLATQVFLDSTAPDIAAVNLSLYAAETTQRNISPPMTLSGEGVDGAVGFSTYEVSLGTSAGVGDIVNWREMIIGTDSFTGLNLSAGTYYVNLRASDLLLNYTEIRSLAFHVALATPVLTLLSPLSSPSNDSNPVLNISGTFVGNTVNIYSDSSCTQLVSSQAATSSDNLSVSVGPLQVDGVYNFFAQLEENGVRSACSSGVSYTFDGTAPQITIALQNPTSGIVSDTFSWVLSFEGADVVNLNSSNISLTGLATTGCQLMIDGSGVSQRTITVRNCNGYGQIGLAITSGVASDSVGNTSLAVSSTQTISLLNRITVDFVGTSDEISEGTTTSQQSFSLRTSGASGEDITVEYNLPVKFNTAPTLNYHNLQSGSLVIPAGQTSATIPYSFFAGAISKGSSVIQVAISSLSGGNSYLGQNQIYRRLIKGEDQSFNVSAVSLGQSQACLSLADGRIKCWGNNESGQAGLGSLLAVLTPQFIDSINSYSQVSTGYMHTCGLTLSNELRCWGNNAYGQFGNGTIVASAEPVTVNVGIQFSRISVGNYATCGISNTSELYCWGSDSFGQLGVGQGQINSYFNVPQLVDAGVSYTKVSLGGSHACGITTEGVLKCWGGNVRGQVGDGTILDKTLPVVIDGGVGYVDVSSGYMSTCAVTSSGQMKCWGDGEIFSTSSIDVFTPILIDSGVQYSTVSTGAKHVCGLRINGQISCFGKNDYGQLGNGSHDPSFTPTVILGGEAFISLSSGWMKTCAVTTTFILRCWGWGYFGLGDGGEARIAQPTMFDQSKTYAKVRGGFNFNCALTTGGVLRCWGRNFNGQVGDGSFTPRFAPISIDVKERYSELSSGNLHACAITVGGVLKCWGANDSGQLGIIGIGIRSDRPLVVDEGIQYKKVATGNAHTCGITVDGKVKCWGSNQHGQVGDGTLVSQATPVEIDSGVVYRDVAISGVSSCGLTDLGNIKCWGSNIYGQIGDGTTVKRVVPVEIDSTTRYASLAMGWFSTCGITTTGSLKCWGYNQYGQIGDGTLVNKLTPTVIDSGTLYTKVSLGAYHGCGITNSNTLKCWGQNSFNQVGVTGSLANVLTPTPVGNSMNFYNLGVGAYHSCAIDATDKIYCWGDNGSYQMGDGMADSRHPMGIVP